MNAKLIRTPYDELADIYRANDRPVVDAQRDGDDESYHATVDNTDRGPAGPRTVVVTDETGNETLSFVMRPNDPIVAAIGAKYAAQMSDPNLPREKRRALHMLILQEISDSKREIEARTASELVGKSAAPGAAPVAAATPGIPSPVPIASPPRTWVAFGIPGAGVHRATYDHAQIDDGVLLLASRLGEATGYYVPPKGVPIDVVIDGAPATVRALLVGAVRFNGWVQVIMIVDDAT